MAFRAGMWESMEQLRILFPIKSNDYWIFFLNITSFNVKIKEYTHVYKHAQLFPCTFLVKLKLRGHGDNVYKTSLSINAQLNF